MLSLWKCLECGVYNYPLHQVCKACFNEYPKQLSPIDRIMSQQMLLFDGYLRMEIFNNLSTKIISQDIINLCNKFYFVTINIETITNKDFYCEEYQNELYELAKHYVKNGNYCIGFQNVLLCMVLFEVAQSLPHIYPVIVKISHNESMVQVSS